MKLTIRPLTPDLWPALEEFAASPYHAARSQACLNP